LKFVVKQLKIFEYFKLMFLARQICVRSVRQQEHHRFSVAFLGSYIGWGKTVLRACSLSITYKYFKLLYLGRRIYVHFIRQQQRQSFSVSFLGSHIR
jgi:hypothetical protein